MWEVEAGGLDAKGAQSRTAILESCCGLMPLGACRANLWLQSSPPLPLLSLSSRTPKSISTDLKLIPQRVLARLYPYLKIGAHAMLDD